MQHHFDALEKTEANYVPLSPVSFLKRARDVYADREAYVFDDTRRNWADFGGDCSAIADQLAAMGIGRGDVVSALAPNLPELWALHFSVPMIGAVLNTINTRVEPETIAYILDHAEAKAVIVDTSLWSAFAAAQKLIDREITVIAIVAEGDTLPDGAIDFATLLDGNRDFTGQLPNDEWDAITLNYTSGTSGRPKGVVYHHRGAYLMALSTVPTWQLTQNPTYLSVVPMFHCNGWTHPWVMALIGGRMIFSRDLSPKAIFDLIERENVTHFGAAPIVLSMLADSPDAPKKPFEPAIQTMTAGAPPPPIVLERTKAMGMNVIQVYGLTETYGHIAHCLFHEDWDNETPERQAELQARQGVSIPVVERLDVIDRDANTNVERDGGTQGEIAIRSNTMMKGYYKDPEATRAAFAGGVFWSGDAAVVHDNGYLQVTDRLKDVIISGGENISSVEVENIASRHPALANVGVVAMPHEKWGEVPCLFAELRDGQTAEEAEVIAFIRERLSGFKTPKKVVFGELPKTATGKIQKFVLREQAKTF